MSGIRVVAFLVRCTENLLFCQDIDTDHLRFADPEACRQRLPALIQAAQRTGASRTVVMGRCRYVVEEAVLAPPE